jgi:hypothetical protein
MSQFISKGELIMKFRQTSAVVGLMALIGFGVSACDTRTASTTGNALHNGASAVERGVENTGRAVERGVDNMHEGIDRARENVGNAMDNSGNTDHNTTNDTTTNNGQ